MELNLNIDPTQCGSRISPMLFGYNVEVTRLGVWRGLSAEMVNNRKFAAADENDLPLQWNLIGAPEMVKIDRNFGYAGNCSLLVLQNNCGVFQTSEVLTFAADRQYNIRLVVHCRSDIPVMMKIICPENGKELFQLCQMTLPGQWTTFTGTFSAAENCENCRLEIISGADVPLHVGAVSIQSADAFFGMRKEVVEIFEKLRPASLRYPGGCYAEFFRWQDSILPVDQRPPVGPTGLPFLLPENDDFDPVDFGLDEFMELCRLIGAEPAMTVRMSEVPASNAADLVEYCNGSVDTFWGGKRAANGHTEPYNIKYWFLGNELWSFGRGGLSDPAVCAQKSAEFAAAMRQADPSIHLTGCSFFAYDEWNHPLQKCAGNLLDEYSMHDYLYDYLKRLDSYDFADVAKAATTRLRPYLERVRDSLLAGIPENKTLTIALDEWNYRWGITGNAAMGIYAAGVLNLLCRESENLHISRGYYFMAVNEGIVRVTPYSAHLDVSGVLFELFKSHHNKIRLLLPPVASEADIDHCASFDPERKELCVTLINRDLHKNHDVEFSLPADYEVESILCRGWEPEEVTLECEKFRTFEVDIKGNFPLSLAPAQVVCCLIKLV